MEREKKERFSFRGRRVTLGLLQLEKNENIFRRCAGKERSFSNYVLTFLAGSPITVVITKTVLHAKEPTINQVM